ARHANQTTLVEGAAPSSSGSKGARREGVILAPPLLSKVCVVFGWPATDTPVPPWWPVRGRQKRRVRQTGPHNPLGRWATWPPPAEDYANATSERTPAPVAAGS